MKVEKFKYRVLELRLNNGNVRYAPQVKKSFFSNWRGIIYDRLGYYWDGRNIMRKLDTYDEARDMIAEYKKYMTEQESREIGEIRIHEANHIQA